VPLALYFGDNGIEIALMIGSVLLLLIVELINSAIEAVVDRFGGEIHELSGRAKDMGSAAVFIAMINVAIIWLFMLF
jgi:diacylglycerol kinase (ATP)